MLSHFACQNLLRRNAPHLVRDLAFVVPNYAWWEAPFYGVGLKLYQALSGRYGFGPSRLLSKKETLANNAHLRYLHKTGLSEMEPGRTIDTSDQLTFKVSALGYRLISAYDATKKKYG